MDHFRDMDLAEVALVVSNKATAPVLDKAKAAGVPTLIITRSSFYESEEVIQQLQEMGIGLIILAGFLWKVPESLVKAFPDKIINIHPALLPKYGGKGMYGQHVHEAVVAAGEEESGISIHLVNEHYDEGRILAQFSCMLSPGETPESLAGKIHQLEHTHFPVVIENWIRNCTR